MPEEIRPAQPPPPPSSADVTRSGENREAQTALTGEGQRRINLIWESTQASIAILVVVANILVWIVVTLKGVPTPIPEGLSNALFLVVGFYFSRTNHAAIGGVGPKPDFPKYDGR